ncbi:MAG: PEP-CTERM sorting domain-containing protein [Planctomycetes bacterium]|nr:PEP-CTERM sorting domain-containing protein [Planctomycetota bacterium]
MRQAQSAFYDDVTGSICLSDLTNVGGIQLISSENGGTVTLIEANANSLGGFFDATSDQQFEWAFFNSPLGPEPLNGGPFDLGAIVPTGTGLTPSEITENFFLGVVLAGSGESDPRANPITFTVRSLGGGHSPCEVPEPNAWLLVGVGLVGFLVPRRKLVIQ